MEAFAALLFLFVLMLFDLPDFLYKQGVFRKGKLLVDRIYLFVGLVFMIFLLVVLLRAWLA